MNEQRHRQGESERRQHRALALFTVIHCWMRGLDGVVFSEEQLVRILGLKKLISRKRGAWLEEDFGDFFPYRKRTMWAGKTDQQGKLNSFSSFWVSRRWLPKDIWSQPLSDEDRLKKIPPDGPRIAVFEMWPDSSSPDIARTGPDAKLFLGDDGNYDEKLMASYLTLLCQGLISPKAIPSLQPAVDILDVSMAFAQKLAAIRARQARTAPESSK